MMVVMIMLSISTKITTNTETAMLLRISTPSHLLYLFKYSYWVYVNSACNVRGLVFSMMEEQISSTEDIDLYFSKKLSRPQMGENVGERMHSEQLSLQCSVPATYHPRTDQTANTVLHIGTKENNTKLETFLILFWPANVSVELLLNCH